MPEVDVMHAHCGGRAEGRRMSVILLILGIVVAAAGITTIAFGIPINESSP
jgi:hypothetical protein